ncbi:MAG: YmdB family metallophosphoesterase [Oscillospiraceae bacterium]|nr:YmdB family metallophosphoesterase [Oscillospiraceae bacterium]
MRILTVGDVVALPGREYIFQNLNKIRAEYSIDFCIVNGENVCSNNGINKEYFDMLIDRGADVVTLGNHSFANNQVVSVLEEDSRLIRPANYPPETAGMGYTIQDLGYAKVAVINAMGRVNMDPLDCPFRAVDRILNEIGQTKSAPFPALKLGKHSNMAARGSKPIIIVDFHAETTSEKIAFANYFDGRVNIVFGTHTHVQTADERVLPGGTAYITDLGMTGVHDSVLGVKKEIIIKNYITRRRQRYEKALGEVWFNGCVFDVDVKTGAINGIERLFLKA